jgi:hypothetical protein
MRSSPGQLSHFHRFGRFVGNTSPTQKSSNVRAGGDRPQPTKTFFKGHENLSESASAIKRVSSLNPLDLTFGDYPLRELSRNASSVERSVVRGPGSSFSNPQTFHVEQTGSNRRQVISRVLQYPSD